MLAVYRRTLDIALRHQFITLLVFLATVALTVVLYIEIPKGFFPPQDTGVVLGITEGAQDVSFKEMARIQQAARTTSSSQDPDVAAYAATVGAGIGGQTEQQRPDVHRPEAVGSARRRHRAGVHRAASGRSCRR